MTPHDFATDPEVAADLIRRARTEREQGRTKDARNPFGSAAIVESWPCRGGCGAMVGITQEGLDAFAAGNAILKKRREAPIGKHQVMWCPECKRRDDELAQMQREAAAAARRPAEQQGLPLGEQRPTGMQNPRRRKSL